MSNALDAFDELDKSNEPDASDISDEVSTEVFFSDQEGLRYLHIGSPWVQGAMQIGKPYALALEYVQRMMAWLLFVPDLRALEGMRAMQLGLGAGALTKFCYKQARMHTVAVEINPQVVRMCRAWFKLPPDNAKLKILETDAEQVIQAPQWQGKIDVLQVDMYDAQAAAPILNSPEAYTQCRALLSDHGVMTVNLFGRSMAFEQSLDNIVGAFGSGAVWVFKPTREGNTIVVALREPKSPSFEVLQSRASAIEQALALPAKKWVKALSPLATYKVRR